MIETIKNAELKENKETLLKNMKMLRHTIADMLGSKSFFQGLEPGVQIGVITVNEEQFPVYVTANTLGTDGVLISDDIFDEENYLSLVSDDDLFWYALVEHLAHQADLLHLECNKRLGDEMHKLRVQLNSYSGASVVNKEDTQQTITKGAMAELTARINELEEENKSLKKKKEELLDYNTKLRQEITSLRINAGLSVADSVDGIQDLSSILEPHIVNANDDMKYIITYKALDEVTARINELETSLKDKDERINQLSKNNAALSVENKNLGELLKNADRDVRFYAREVDNLEKEIKDLQSKEEAGREAFNLLKERYLTE